VIGHSYEAPVERIDESGESRGAGKQAFFTVGHSNRSIEEFIALISASQIALVADIRKIPKSRANPQFNADALADALAAAGISYERIEALGGRRTKARNVALEVNGFWENRSFHNYADYALSAVFEAGLQHLIEQGRRRRCAMMCSEAVWWRCHRRIVSDHLLARGETVMHIMARNRVEPAKLTGGAVPQAGGGVIYPGAS
jgi:uncharacterized protein (DUF488 family)